MKLYLGNVKPIRDNIASISKRNVILKITIRCYEKSSMEECKTYDQN
jgi:hypothetical protein